MILTVVVGGSSSWQTRGSIARRRLSEIKNITKLPVTMFKAGRQQRRRAGNNAWTAREQVLPRRACTCVYVHTGTCINHAREGEGSRQQPATGNRQQGRRTSRRTTNLSKQLLIRAFNAKNARTTNRCESNVFVCCCELYGQTKTAVATRAWQKRAPLCLQPTRTVWEQYRVIFGETTVWWRNFSLICGLPSVFIICIWINLI